MAMPDGTTVKTSKASVGFQYCAKLFSLKKKTNEKSRKEYRWNAAWPLLEEYFYWLETLRPEKGSKLEEAAQDSLNPKQQFMTFLENRDVPISNNLAENTIRPFPVGRKTGCFVTVSRVRSPMPLCNSLVETVKANGQEPYDYLLYVLILLPFLGKSSSHDEFVALMP